LPDPHLQKENTQETILRGRLKTASSCSYIKTIHPIFVQNLLQTKEIATVCTPFYRTGEKNTLLLDSLLRGAFMSLSNPYAKQAGAYKQNQVETASSEEILIMLYDGAIRFLLLAKKAHEQGDMEKRHKNVLNAQHIIQEFMNSLDMEIGGEMAVNLFRLYEYLNYRLIQFNLKKDVAMVDEVLDHLRSLKTTWEEAIRITKKERVAFADESDPIALRA
jgi:flagellar protein FliS